MEATSCRILPWALLTGTCGLAMEKGGDLRPPAPEPFRGYTW